MMKRLAMTFTVAAVFIALAGLAGGGAGFAPLAHAQDYSAPTVPTGVSAGTTQSNQIYIYWGESTDDVGVVGYYLYRNGALVANTPGIPDYTDTPSPGTYYYTIAAYDVAGNVSGQSAPTPYITVLPDNQAPTTPANVVPTPSSSSVSLSWDASTDNVLVIGYYVYRNGLKVFTSDAITATTYVDGGLLPGNRYTYSVASYDAAGNVSTHSPTINVTTVFDVTPPSTPTNLLAAAASPTEIDLSWRASTDNISVAGYNIYRAGDLIGTTASTSYADAGVEAQTSYGYDVVAYDSVGNVSRAASVSMTTPPPDIAPPSIPGAISGRALDASDIVISWRASTDNVSVAGYNIFRDGNQIATTASTSYTDSGLTTSTVYQYAVTAFDGSGNTSPQNSVAVTTLSYNPIAPAPAPAPSPIAPPPAPNGGNGGATITTNLYYGLRTPDVLTLQTVLIAQGDLGPTYGTGFYGSLTQAAVKKFQCDKAIVCSGAPATTGWGSVGPRTRKALSAF